MNCKKLSREYLRKQTMLISAIFLSSAAMLYSQVTVPRLTGYTMHKWGEDQANPCVPDVHAALSSLRMHGDIGGFHMNGAVEVDYRKQSNPDFFKTDHHWQGIQRLMSGEGKFLVVSRGGAGIAFVVVKMGSRNSRGERFRSNRLAYDKFAHETAPPSEDGVFRDENGNPKQIPEDLGFDHAGGMQAIGNFLLVPLENPDMKRSRVVFYDVSNPTAPKRLPYFVDNSSTKPPSIRGHASAAAITKLHDGRYLLAIHISGDGTLELYVSTTTNLRDPSTRFNHFNTVQLQLIVGLPGYYTFQNINFINQCDGKIYLIGTSKVGGFFNAPFSGDDFVIWFLIKNGSIANPVIVSELGKRHMYCDHPTRSLIRDATYCNFDAAAGIYIDPTFNIILYSTEHSSDDLPFVTDKNGNVNGTSVKFEEFRSERPVEATTINEAWVEFYDDTNFRDRGIMVDYIDSHLRNYSNFDKVEGFEDKTSAIKWSIPPAWRFRVYADKNYNGTYIDLVGSGELNNLKHHNFNDKISSAQWIYQRKGLGILSLRNGRIEDVGILSDEEWAGDWHYNSFLNTIQKSGDFDGNGQDDMIITSSWGLGILTLEGSSMTSLVAQPNDTLFGDWRLNTTDNQIVGVGDFDSNDKDDVLITSPWGLGVLTLEGNSMTSLVAQPNETWFGGWRLNTKDNQIVGVGDFDNNGKDDVLIVSPWGLGILTLEGKSMTSLVAQPNETLFGDWRLNTKDNHIVGIGDFDNNGKDDVLITSPWGLGVLTLERNSMTSLVAKPNDTWFGDWRLNTSDHRISSVADFDGNGKDDILITSPWGLGILTLNGNSMTSLVAQPNDTWFGDWRLNTNDNQVVGTGDFDNNRKQDIFIRSPWGIGILSLSGNSLASLKVEPYGAALGAWNLEQTDKIVGLDNFGRSAGTEILVQISNVNISGATASNLALLNQTNNELPANFELYQNYPNPFNPTTTISYLLPRLSPVTLKVYELSGREIMTLIDEIQEPGSHSLKFDASRLPSGVYFYRLKADSFVETKKMALIR